MLPALAACSPLTAVNLLSPSDHYDLAVDVAYGNLDRQRLDVYMPKGTAGPSPVVIFFYGGGWNDGSKERYQFVGSSL